MPGISVILPVRQGEDDLRECAESVRAQTFDDWELIVVDDGSTDDTEELCKTLAAEDDRIRVFRRKKSSGMNEARNLGLKEAKGDFVVFLDVKDRYEPFALETMWSAAQEADTVGFACSVPGGGERVTVFLGEAGLYEKETIRANFVTPLFAQRLRLPIMGGQVWRWLFSAKLVRDGNLSFRGKYLTEELFTLEYLCLSRRLAVTEQMLCRRGASSAPVGYRKDLLREFDRYMERKTAIVKKYGLDAPLWKENTLWAGLLTLVENEYHRGNTAKTKEKQKAVETLCKREDFAAAIETLTPEGLHPNRQMTANYIRGKHFFMLTQLYRLKFGI